MKKVRYCNLCGDISDTTGPYCQKCYNYLRRHPEGVYPLPAKGEVAYAPNGDCICHICGMAYRKLGNHIMNRHGMTQNAYREEYGLHHNTKLSSKEYISMMKDYNDQYYNLVVKENLLVGGKLTRLADDYTIPKRKIGNNQIKEKIYKNVKEKD